MGNPQPYGLLIEEIIRAPVAAVFGDVFQLLDRGSDGVSQYKIETREDIRRYLAEKLGGELDNYQKNKIPDNMFIWATMNSADQGVFPITILDSFGLTEANVRYQAQEIGKILQETEEAR